jgi:hypothetical protein
MKQNKEHYVSKREKSISPNISQINFENKVLSQIEISEANFYSMTVSLLTKEIFDSIEESLYFTNYNIKQDFENSIKSLNSNEINELLNEYFESINKEFVSTYKDGEASLSKILAIENMELESDVTKYLKRKNGINESFKSENDSLKGNNQIDDNKFKYIKNLRENILLKLELALEKKIIKANSLQINNLKEKFFILEEKINNKPDINYVSENMDIIYAKLKTIDVELKKIK